MGVHVHAHPGFPFEVRFFPTERKDSPLAFSFLSFLFYALRFWTRCDWSLLLLDLQSLQFTWGMTSGSMNTIHMGVKHLFCKGHPRVQPLTNCCEDGHPKLACFICMEWSPALPRTCIESRRCSAIPTFRQNRLPMVPA